FPELSTATPSGAFTVALVAGPPSPEYPQLPGMPATLEMMAAAEILRTTQLLGSARNISPDPSTLKSLTNPTVALMAGPPLSEFPQCNNPVVFGGVPASVEMTPVEAETLRIRQFLVSAMKSFPELSTATPEG